MGQRAQKVVVRSGRTHIYYDGWGAEDCEASLLAGLESLEREWARYQEAGWISPAYCEAGYLLDFDTRTMLFGPGCFYPEEAPEYFDALRARLQQAWLSWKIAFVENVVSDFQAYLNESRAV
jgi:hypothetical protein